MADIVKDIKTNSSKWIKQNDVFPGFIGWQDGYGAFTHSSKEKDSLIEYIKSQEEHHKKTSFREELVELLKEAGVDFEVKYLP